MHRIILFIVFIFISLTLLSSNNPEVVIETEFGNIRIEIYLDAAPITAKNFLHHVKNKIYDRSNFYRTVKIGNQPDNQVKIEVIQAGHNNSRVIEKYGKEFSKKPGIKHETTKKTGILHKDGTISMARGKPGTAVFSYFICINDQPSLDFGGKRNPDGHGFAAFGKVLEGMEIIRKIQNSPAVGQSLKPPVKVKQIRLLK